VDLKALNYKITPHLSSTISKSCPHAPSNTSEPALMNHSPLNLTHLQQQLRSTTRKSQIFTCKDSRFTSLVAHHLAFSTILPAMLWASPIWWNGTPAVLDPLQISCNPIARWITGLPTNTRVTKHLICARLPPLDRYLDYLSQQYAIDFFFFLVTT
jgi:hypothetical protein